MSRLTHLKSDLRFFLDEVLSLVVLSAPARTNWVQVPVFGGQPCHPKTFSDVDPGECSHAPTKGLLVTGISFVSSGPTTGQYGCMVALVMGRW